ncbi:Ig-like domain-containing protein, partial [Pantoea sp. GbtcB22]|uniref:Ig-like domain-containing protein n=1 Tax=Pantoea sp. GbtcB22 TaxID=2824767 RepID=UPI0020C6FB9A
GPHSFTARATDPAGNTGLPSIPFTFIVDTVIAQPLLETVSDAVTGGVEGAISNDGTGLTNDARPVLSGRAEAGSLVTIYDGSSAIGSVRADAATGAWRWQSSENLGEGVHLLTVQATDPAGNVSVMSDSFTITIDTLTVQPVIATITDAVSGGTVGAVASDGTGLTNDARPLLNGTAEKGSLVTVYDGISAIGSVYADAATGIWSWKFTGADKFDEGSHTLCVKAIDAAGNTSILSDSFTITVDTLIAQPILATITDAVSGGNLGSIPNNGTGLTNDARPLLSGSAEKGSLVTIYDGSTAVGSVYADAATGAWSWQYAGAEKFEDGVHTLTVSAADPAGNRSQLSDSIIITVDTHIAQPTLASVTDTVTGGTLGAIANDGTGLTNDARPLLSGNAEKGSLITIYDGISAIGSVYADAATGAWSWQYSGADKFEEGPHTLTVQAVDQAGNISARSPSFTITVDDVVSVPLVTGIYDKVAGGITGLISDNGITNDSSPTITGTAEPGALVRLRLTLGHGSEWGEEDGVNRKGFNVIADKNGNWSLTIPETLPDGEWYFRAEQTDLAGNYSGLGSQYIINIDTTPPVLQGLIRIGDILKVDLTGTHAQIGDLLKIKIGSENIEHLLTAEDVAASRVDITLKKWSYTDTYNATLTDIAGNESPLLQRIPYIQYTDLESITPQTVASGASLDLGLFNFTAGSYDSINDGTAGIIAPGTVIAGMASPTSNILLLRSSGGSELNKLTLKGNDSATYFSVEIRDLESLLTIRFYDLSGNLAHTVLQPSGGNDSLINFQAEMPEGINFHSVSFEFRAGDGISLDNFALGNRAQDNLGVTSRLMDNPLNDSASILFELEHEVNLNQFIQDHRLNLETIEPESLMLSIGDVLSHGQGNFFASNDNIQLLIEGHDTNNITLSDLLPDGTDSGDWNQVGDITIAGVQYISYAHDGAGIEVFIQQGINVNMENN